MDDKGLYIVTGATGGIGRALTEGLCRKGLRVVMACRNMEKAEAVRQGIMRSGRAGNGEITVRTLDMASLGSIGRFAEELRSEGAEIAALVNNAGVMSARFGLTADGIEQCMGVNYVGPYALTRLLLPMLADGGRIVNTLSVTYRIGRIGPRLFEPEPQRYERFRSYGSSKLALLLFTLELARRTAGRIGVYAADPGVVNTGMITMHRWFDPLTDLLFRPLIKSPEQGARTALALATGDLPDERQALYWVGMKPKRVAHPVTCHPGRQALWEQTERLVEKSGIKFA